MEHTAIISLSPAPLSSLPAHDILQWLRLKIAQALRRGSIRESSSYPSARRHKFYPSIRLSPCPERLAEFYGGRYFLSLPRWPLTLPPLSAALCFRHLISLVKT